MSRCVCIAEVSYVANPAAALVNPAASSPQEEGGEIRERVDEYFVRELKYCKRSEMLIPSG